MKKIKNLLLSVCLSISFMFGCLVPSISVYAVGDSWTPAQSYTYFQNQFDDINTRLNGIIINQNNLEQDFEDFLQEYRDNYNISSGTSSSTWIGDNINGTYQNGSSGVSDLSFSQTFRQAMRDWINAYIQTNTGFTYVWSTGSSAFLNGINNQTQFHEFLDLLNDNSDKLALAYNGAPYVWIAQQDLQLVRSSKINGTYQNVNVYYNWESANSLFDKYTWNSNSQTYELTDQGVSPGNQRCVRLSPNEAEQTSYTPIVQLNAGQLIMYNTFDSMKAGTEGVQEYYVTDSYNSSISGSYNTTTNNIENTIGSNNINNYINNYYVENGKYPTSGEVNVYITNNINNGGGNNNGGGDDNNNNDDDNNNNIWDFLGSIGDFLGHLISSLGSVLSGILSLLTDVIDLFIGEDGIPNVFSQLVSYYLSFLPTEFLRLIELFVVCSLIIGVIKLIRGS